MSSTACLEMMAQSGAYARRDLGQKAYAVNFGGQKHLFPAEVFEDLIALRFVQSHPGGEWTITPAGQTQAEHGTQAPL